MQALPGPHKFPSIRHDSSSLSLPPSLSGLLMLPLAAVLAFSRRLISSVECTSPKWCACHLLVCVRSLVAFKASDEMMHYWHSRSAVTAINASVGRQQLGDSNQ